MAQLVEALRFKPEDCGLIPDGVNCFFHLHNPSGHNLFLGSTLPLTEISNRVSAGGKVGRFVGLTTLPPSCGDCLGILGSFRTWMGMPVLLPSLEVGSH